VIIDVPADALGETDAAPVAAAATAGAADAVAVVIATGEALTAAEALAGPLGPSFFSSHAAERSTRHTAMVRFMFTPSPHFGS
jgi:hypothetical protein